MTGLVVLAVAFLVFWAIAKLAEGRRDRSQGSRSSSARREGSIPAALKSAQVVPPGGMADPSTRPAAAWVPKGQEITIAGYKICGGMIYVGQGLASVGRAGGVEPALINPRLPVDPRQPDRQCSMMSYWPSYSGIPAVSRAAYLEWLAGGRNDPSVGIGHVFLFFYGLERRLLVDAQRSETARAEVSSILDEIGRLLKIHGSNGSFKGYAASLLGFMKVALRSEAVYNEAPPLSNTPELEVPLTVRLALGQLALEGKPIPADWALAWFRSAPSTHLRTPAQRCPEELGALFRLRYKEKLGSGLVVKPNKTTIRASYRPASASFSGSVHLSFSDSTKHEAVPDVAALHGPLATITEIAEGCISDLEPYSRWVGRNPKLRSSPAAIALLPGDLVAHFRSDDVDALSKAIEFRLGTSSFAEVPMIDLMEHWNHVPAGKFHRADGVLLAQLLEKRGYGLEPDPRFGGPAPDPEKTGVVFRLPTGAPSAPTAAYAAAAVTLQLAVAVAVADERVSQSELELLRDHLIGSLPVTPQEHVRLEAYLRWLLVELPSPTGLGRRLEAMEPSQRVAIGRFLVAVATADGQIAPQEVSTLSRLYKLLGLDQGALYSELHAQSISETPTTTTAVDANLGRISAPGYAIGPPAQTSRPVSVALDMKRVEVKLAQTAAVSALLGSIFVDDEEAVRPPRATDIGNVASLDDAHSALLRELAGHESWPRVDFEHLAAKHGVLPDGALDAINEVSLEKSGESCLEGDDPILINLQAMKELGL